MHQDHGIGRFLGLETIEVAGAAREFMVLVYQGGDKLKVPIESFDRVQKYSSAEGAPPVVDRLGSGNWEKVKKRVKKAMRDMAAELLRLYAERKARPGHAFTGESPWQREFEEAFEYEETKDQAAAIADVARDMAAPVPMDRLICGDVGYGKTEVAMRAAMRAVLDGKQVALLAPTTVLAFQHWKTFRKRFAPFPVKVDMVSRFRTPREMKAVLAALPTGGIDVLIGTHRLLSKDVVFRDLGLLVIDEEQRFGVAAKEKLKHLKTTVDCLTLSATPIPRTLQMGLAGIRDMSVIETPPKDRLAIETSHREVLDGRDRGRHPPGAGPRRPGLLRAQPRGVDLLPRQPRAEAGAGGQGGGGPRPDAGDGAREGHARLRGGAGGRARGHHHHRERPRHPAREHHGGQPRGPLRPRPALPAPGPGGPLGPARPTRTCSSPRTPCSPRSRGSAWPPSASSPTSGRASASPPSTSSCGAPATSSAASRAATSRPWASTST